jgi:hypothetical protein
VAEPLAELLGEPLMTLDLEALTRLRRPLVYVWTRCQDVLYVGSSGNGVERPLARGHEKLRGFQAGDTLTIWPAADAAATEVDLIRRLRPLGSTVMAPSATRASPALSAEGAGGWPIVPLGGANGVRLDRAPISPAKTGPVGTGTP